jgi:hypothetical protein
MNERYEQSITSATTNLIKHLQDSDVRTVKLREFKQNLFRNRTQTAALLELREKKNLTKGHHPTHQHCLEPRTKKETNSVAKLANPRSCLLLTQGSKLFRYTANI